MDCCVIILAGGKGERMGHRTHFFTKPTFLAYDRPILGRLIEQAYEAGLKNIYVSTSPIFFTQIKSFVSCLKINSPSKKETKIRVFKNRAHTQGSLEALKNILELVRNPRCIMCLGDIFFLSNPFISLIPKLSGKNNYLGVAKSFNLQELTKGGIVHCKGGKIISIAEHPQEHNKKGLRWSGIALFNRKQVKDLKNFLLQFPSGSPEGDFFEFYRKRGNPVYAILGPDFVNVNTADELLLASLYAVKEAHKKETKLAKTLTELINIFRLNLLNNS